MCQQHIRPVCYILRRYAWLYAYKLQTGCPMSNVMHTSCKLDVLWVVWLKWMSVLFVVNTRHSGWHDLSSLMYDSTNRWGSSQDWSFQTLQDPVSKLCSSLFPLESVDWSLAKVCGGGCQPVHGKDQEVRDTVISIERFSFSSIRQSWTCAHKKPLHSIASPNKKKDIQEGGRHWNIWLNWCYSFRGRCSYNPPSSLGLS